MFLGLLFRNTARNTTTNSIFTRTSLLFYILSFFTLMAVAVIPTRFNDKIIVRKEESNRYYHPILHHFANTLASVFAVLIITVVVTAVYVPMEKTTNPLHFSIVLFLTLIDTEALTQIVTLVAHNYIYAMSFYVGLLGFFIPLMGFMIVPSEFPNWLKWAHYVPFYTYAWRSLMICQFQPNDQFDSQEFPTGLDVLKFYEIDTVDYEANVVLLFLYGLIIHFFCMVIICVKHSYIASAMNKGIKSHQHVKSQDSKLPCCEIGK